MQSVRGQLLIAAPALTDPNFFRTVVLVVEHSDAGALGVVLNRPSETAVGDATDQLQDVVDLDDLLFVGGPVQPSAMIVVAQFEDPRDAVLLAFDDVGVLAAGEPPAQVAAGILRARAFVGHAGWAPGQLDGELDRGDWIVDAACHDDAFASDPEALWKTALVRKGGQYALLASMPPDPTLN